MGFWDKLEKAAKKIEDFTAKADAYLDKTFPDEKEKYTKDEIYAHYRSTFTSQFYHSILEKAKLQNKNIVRFHWDSDDANGTDYKTSSIKVLDNEDIELTFKGMIFTEDEYGDSMGIYKVDVIAVVNCYRERVRTTITLKR